MDLKAERLNEAYRHVFAFYGIDSKNKFAEAVKVQRTAMSAAMNGNERYLTKNLFIKVCAAFPDVFNLDYFLDGRGRLLKNEDSAPTLENSESSKKQNNTNILEGIVKDIERELADIRLLRVELQQARGDLKTATAELTILVRQLNSFKQLDVSADENLRIK